MDISEYWNSCLAIQCEMKFGNPNLKIVYCGGLMDYIRYQLKCVMGLNFSDTYP